MTPPTAHAFDTSAPWQLNEQVSLRDESFGALAYHHGTRRLVFLKSRELVEVVRRVAEFDTVDAALDVLVPTEQRGRYVTACRHWFVRRFSVSAESSLRTRFERGLAAPICLTWELTYACNLACTHCLSSSGRRDPNELSTAEAKALIDEIAAMQIFYINIGGGEPMIRRDFFELIEYAVGRHVGVKFSTNGTRIDAAAARRLASIDYLDVQVSIDGVDALTSDRIRGVGSYDAARRAMDNLKGADFGQFKISVVMTRDSIEQLDEFEQLAAHYGAELRLTRLRPSGRGVDTWQALHPTLEQNRRLYRWLLARPNVLTGDSFFHLSALGESLPGLNLCGAGRVVCLIDPVGEVYACPFVIHDEFRAGNVRAAGFREVWQHSELFTSLREPGNAGACTSCGSYDACRGGCMAAKFFTGLEMSDPDPECVFGHGETALAAKSAVLGRTPSPDHSRKVPVSISAR